MPPPGLRVQLKAPQSQRGVDLYETPPEATHALMRAEALPHAIWECCSGPGAIVRVLRAAGHHVLATDLVDYRSPDQDAGGRDFLRERTLPPGIEMILTNPPYRSAAEMAVHALRLCPRVIMLLRLNFLECGDNRTAAGRARLLALDGGKLARFHVFINRLPMLHRDGWDGNRVSNPTAFAWFVWDRNHHGPAMLHRILWKPLPATMSAPPNPQLA
jgi:hypothetical protein